MPGSSLLSLFLKCMVWFEAEEGLRSSPWGSAVWDALLEVMVTAPKS